MEHIGFFHLVVSMWMCMLDKKNSFAVCTKRKFSHSPTHFDWSKYYKKTRNSHGKYVRWAASSAKGKGEEGKSEIVKLKVIKVLDVSYTQFPLFQYLCLYAAHWRCALDFTVVQCKYVSFRISRKLFIFLCVKLPGWKFKLHFFLLPFFYAKKSESPPSFYFHITMNKNSNSDFLDAFFFVLACSDTLVTIACEENRKT